MFTTTFDTNKDRNFQKLEQIYQIWVNLGQFSIFRSPQRPKNESEGNFQVFTPFKKKLTPPPHQVLREKLWTD